MKMKKCVFSSLLVICGMTPALASDCTGAECDFMEMMYADDVAAAPVSYTEPVGYIAPTPIAEYEQPVEYYTVTPIPMRSVKTLSIKPVPEDTRPPLWDGSHNKQLRYTYDKTVDWRDGVPIWDDSIAHYKRKDFSDWFLEPSPEIYLRESDDSALDLYNQNMADAAATRARIDELLEPNRPQFNLWMDDGCDATYAPAPQYTAQDLTEIVNVAFGQSDGCPFDTETECEIWRRKPIVRETVSPRSPLIRADKVDAFISAAICNSAITANESVSAPLLDRYKMLMRSANACCTDGLVYSLKRAGASDGLVYKFMSDDANFYGFGARCLMMTDDELDEKYPNTATAAVAADVRNGCLCRGRQWFAAMLAPFKQVYEAAPEFANQKFYYTYTDGLQRKITVSVNNDVQNVLKQLELCP